MLFICENYSMLYVFSIEPSPIDGPERGLRCVLRSSSTDGRLFMQRVINRLHNFGFAIVEWRPKYPARRGKSDVRRGRSTDNGQDNFGVKTSWHLKQPHKITDYIFCSHKKVILCTIRNGGPLILKKGTFLGRIAEHIDRLCLFNIWRTKVA